MTFKEFLMSLPNNKIHFKLMNLEGRQVFTDFNDSFHLYHSGNRVETIESADTIQINFSYRPEIYLDLLASVEIADKEEGTLLVNQDITSFLVKVFVSAI